MQSQLTLNDLITCPPLNYLLPYGDQLYFVVPMMPGGPNQHGLYLGLRNTCLTTRYYRRHVLEGPAAKEILQLQTTLRRHLAAIDHELTHSQPAKLSQTGLQAPLLDYLVGVQQQTRTLLTRAKRIKSGYLTRCDTFLSQITELKSEFNRDPGFWPHAIRQLLSNPNQNARVIRLAPQQPDTYLRLGTDSFCNFKRNLTQSKSLAAACIKLFAPMASKIKRVSEDPKGYHAHKMGKALAQSTPNWSKAFYRYLTGAEKLPISERSFQRFDGILREFFEQHMPNQPYQLSFKQYQQAIQAIDTDIDFQTQDRQALEEEFKDYNMRSILNAIFAKMNINFDTAFVNGYSIGRYANMPDSSAVERFEDWLSIQIQLYIAITSMILQGKSPTPVNAGQLIEQHLLDPFLKGLAQCIQTQPFREIKSYIYHFLIQHANRFGITTPPTVSLADINQFYDGLLEQISGSDHFDEFLFILNDSLHEPSAQPAPPVEAKPGTKGAFYYYKGQLCTLSDHLFATADKRPVPAPFLLQPSCPAMSPRGVKLDWPPLTIRRSYTGFGLGSTTTIKYCTLDNLTLTRAIMAGCKFSHCHFHRCQFDRETLREIQQDPTNSLFQCQISKQDYQALSFLKPQTHAHPAEDNWVRISSNTTPQPPSAPEPGEITACRCVIS